MSATPQKFDVREALAKERRDAMAAAKAFAQACKEGDVENFHEAVAYVQHTIDGWRLALAKVARLSSVSDDIKNAFLMVWIESQQKGPITLAQFRARASKLANDKARELGWIV